MQEKDRSPIHSDVKGRLGLDAPDVKSSQCFATWSLVQSRVENQKHFLFLQCSLLFSEPLSPGLFVFLPLETEEDDDNPLERGCPCFSSLFPTEMQSNQRLTAFGSAITVGSILKTYCDRALRLKLQDFGTSFPKTRCSISFQIFKRELKTYLNLLSVLQ